MPDQRSRISETGNRITAKKNPGSSKTESRKRGKSGNFQQTIYRKESRFRSEESGTGRHHR